MISALRHIAVFFVAAIYLALGGELLSRLHGGYAIFVPKLTRLAVAPAKTEVPSVFERQFLEKVTFERSADEEWFFSPPSALAKPPNPELNARSALGSFNGVENYLWNEYYIRHPDQNLIDWLDRLKVDEIFAFPSYENSPWPHFRLYRSSALNVGTTNSFGWLSSEIEVPKLPNTIRVGMLGDSTMHNTIGRYVQSFLNRWGEAKARGIRFEVLNASRQGLAMADLNSILRYELGPMSLDYVYIYKGPIINYPSFAKMPAGVTFGKPPPDKPRVPDALREALAPLLPWSALASNTVAGWEGGLPASPLAEPDKPEVEIELPAGLDQQAPTVEQARVSPFFNTELEDLDNYRRIALQLHATPLVSTERWLVPRKKPLLNGRDRLIFDKLNGPEFWPLRYAQIDRLLRLNNRVIEAWAKANGVGVVDIDGYMPREPQLYVDGAHDTELGQRLRAWIIFQYILGEVKRDLARGERDLASASLPRPPPTRLIAKDPILRYKRADLVRSYHEMLETDPAWLSENQLPAIDLDENATTARLLSLSRLKILDAGASLQFGPPVIVQTSPHRVAYAASAAIDEDDKRKGAAIVEISLRLLDGRVWVGLLSKDGSQFLAWSVLPDDTHPKRVRFRLKSLEDIGSFVVGNYQKTDGITSKVEIDYVKVFQADAKE
jgi:hypothetical protein